MFKTIRIARYMLVLCAVTHRGEEWKSADCTSDIVMGNNIKSGGRQATLITKEIIMLGILLVVLLVILILRVA
jgi:hypothetical protein